jgi:hypothetical protein
LTHKGNVLIIDESGLIQAAAIAIYYVMNKINVSLAKSFSIEAKEQKSEKPFGFHGFHNKNIMEQIKANYPDLDI